MIQGGSFDRVEIARQLAVAPALAPMILAEAEKGRPAGETLQSKMPAIDWSLTGHPDLAPQCLPTPQLPDYAELPGADVIVMTWTVDEWQALDYVFSDPARLASENATPGVAVNGENDEDGDGDEREQPWQKGWVPYRRDFYSVTPDLWGRRLSAVRQRRAAGAPSLSHKQRRWGSYRLVAVGNKTVLLFKSEMHLNQDDEGLPVAKLVRRIVCEANPDLVLSIGTGGGLDEAQALGDAVVTNAARFRLSDEFGSAHFNDRTFRSSYQPPDDFIDAIKPLLAAVPEINMKAPTAQFPEDTQLVAHTQTPQVRIDTRPILTTDFFEYGTTANGLGQQGCVCDMGDAVIGMVIDELNEERKAQKDVLYGFVRNVSDPVMNAELPEALRDAWSVATYTRQGLLTSFNGALATWALIAAPREGRAGV